MTCPNRPCIALAFLLTLAFACPPRAARADGPKDNIADKVRPIPPPPTVELTAADRGELEAGVAALGREIEGLRRTLADKPRLLDRLADVQIYYNAVRYPLAYHEMCDPKAARKALADGTERAKQLAAGQTPWLATSGPRGYVSKIDGSVQLYRLGVPAGYDPGAADRSKPYRFDFLFHGRDEELLELKFLGQPSGTPQDKFVVSLYGRYCNASKFAGEIDFLEVMDDVRKLYPLDENRKLVIGFSMGGAACWHLAVHYTDLWAAASPGAGFSETPDFLKVFQKETLSPPPYEQTLWHLYDCTDYAANLFDVPTIAYSGEIDPQKQAADVMEKAVADEGMKLERIIGPKTAHKYEPNARKELDERLDAIIAKGRNPVPAKLRFTTWTLRYNRMFWLTVDGLEHHWQRARADAEITDDAVSIKTQNVSALSLNFPQGQRPWPEGKAVKVLIDGQAVAGASPAGHFVKADGQWQAGAAPVGLRKQHGLQGPIDDAFLDHFLIVRPTGKPLHDKTGNWAAAECAHAIAQWRQQFRGEALVKDDSAVTDADLAAGNVVLFGDPSSNRVLAKIADRLPIRWTADAVTVGPRSYPGDHHAPVLIYPNPLSPSHYVVINSGFTYREYDYLNNARQTPKLPDYAVIDVNVPVTSRAPGGVVEAGFFNEKWELPAQEEKGGR